MNARAPAVENAVPVLTALAACAETTMRDVPAETLHAARRCVVDWLGVAIAGMGEPPVQHLRSVLVAEGSPDAVLGVPDASAFADAMLMGTAGHVLDYDDTDYVNLVHVSASVVPALVAVARRYPLRGDALLRALVAGYEMEAALGRFLGRPLTARGWHVSGALGHMGAALAAALALGVRGESAAQAMAVAATGSSGFIAAFGTMAKSLQLGRTAAGGVLAAELAARGFTGPVGVLDAEIGFADTLVGTHIDRWHEAPMRWGAPYAILANSFKPHASCMITHASVDAAMQVHAALARDGLDWRDVAAIRCRVNVLVPKVAGCALPASGLQGKFSLAYCVVAGIIDGHANPDVFADAAVAREPVRLLLDRTAVVVDPAIGEQQADITVTLSSGRVLQGRTSMAKGNPANPMSDDDLGGKFLALTRPRLRDAPAALAELWHFERVPDAGTWLRTHLN